MNFKRIFLIVLDSLGTGEAADAKKFNSTGADTLGSISKVFDGNLNIPNLQKLGISNIREKPLDGVSKVQNPLGAFGKLSPNSVGNESIDGHWELMCLETTKFDFFPDGFPDEIIDKVSTYSGRKIIGNKPASGTEIIKELGQEQLQTGALIVYTSADSVFQIAAHESIIPVDELYSICKYTRELLNGPKYKVGRIIARPYIGNPSGDFTRTDRRKDFTIEPSEPSVLDLLNKADLTTIGVGKTIDLFSNVFDKEYHNKNNMHGMDNIDEVMSKDFTGFCFANLVDFDSKYGHRRDPIGYGKALMNFDKRLGYVLDNLLDTDLLIITADHGNDPCYKGTDHTRENVPLLVYSPSIKGYINLGLRDTFADVGKTILDNFNIKNDFSGTSFLGDLMK